MADQQPPAPDAAKKPTDGAKDAEPVYPETREVTRFRVAHGAVSGYKPDRKGVLVPHDFYEGDLVTEQHLDGEAAAYLSLGAIVPHD